MTKLSTIDWIAFVLVIIGGLNWGLVAINPTWDLVAMLQISWLIKLVYALVALSAIYLIVIANKLGKSVSNPTM
jgi:uncharacterized protein